MGRTRNAEPTSPVTFTLPTAHLELLRAESVELYGTADRYANIIRADVRAGLAERGALNERPRPKPQRSFVERWIMPPIGGGR